MSKLARIAVLVTALLSLPLTLSAPAGAVTWHRAGDEHFALIGGAFTYSATGVSLTCSISDHTATAAGAVVVGATYSITMTDTYTGCRTAGIASVITCSSTFTGIAWTAGPPAVTSGSLDRTCNLTQGGVKVCHIEGQTPGSYTNPSGATKGRLSLAFSTALRTTNGPAGNCILGNGDTLTVTMETMTVSSAGNGPVLTRTP